MATAPMQPAMAPSDDPSAESDKGFCIEIHVAAGGAITVSVEDEAEEAQEEGASDGGAPGAPAGGDDEGSEQGTPVKNIKEALTLALEIFKAGGDMPGQADDSFQQGFDGSGA